MTASNYDMAHECMRSAENANNIAAPIEAMAAQTYATLALVDELRAQRQDIRDTVAEEVSSALMDMKGGASKAGTMYVIADSAKDALTSYQEGILSHENLGDAVQELQADIWTSGNRQPAIYRVSVEVVQP